MNIRFNVRGITVDRRTADLHRRHDEIERKRFEKRVEQNIARRRLLKRLQELT
jgi:hypothetical protein